MFMLLRVFGLQCLALAVLSQEGPSPVVSTIYGDVQGERLLDVEDRMYDAFLGIPYARPPVDDLRWAKPQAPEPWDEVLEVSEYQAHCLQVVSRGYRLIGLSTNHSEDCLYVNVHVPRGVDAQPELRPVVVYYYGGGFLFGAQEMYPPQHLANYGDLVAVSFDYRVSSLGFLSTGDAVVPGNLGLWDGQFALTWVQQNIAAFGGDPNRVTIYGQSAGGAMVSLTTISPSTEGLFNGAIAMSGGSVGFLGTREESYNYLMTQFLGDIFDCNSTDSQEIIDCLMEVEGESIVFWGSTGTIPSKNISILLRPVVDNDFLVEDPRLSYEGGRNADIHFITGNCKDDAAGTVVGNFFGLPINRTDGDGGTAETIEGMTRALHNMMGAASNKDELMQMIVDEYPLLYSDDMQTRTVELSEAETDWHYAAASHFEADTHSTAGGLGRTYRYLFNYDQSFLNYPDWINGSHTDELYSLFGQPYLVIARLLWFQFGDFTEEDHQVSNNIMSYFTNFAYTYDPNTGPMSVPSQWPEYDPVSRPYQLLSLNPYTDNLNDPDKLGKYDFWNNEFYAAAQPPDLSDTPTRFFMTDEELLEIVDDIKERAYESQAWSVEEWEDVSAYMDGFIERRKQIIDDKRKA